MKERPIIMNASEVRSILAGRKTQTRRVVRPQPSICAGGQLQWVNSGRSISGATLESLVDFIGFPYGQPGDRLWVREMCKADELPSGLDGVRYFADDAFVSIENTEQAAERWGELACYGMKKSGRAECRTVPSIHMPRWASRILLEIVSVRVERLQDISEEDAIAEGVAPYHLPVHPDREWLRHVDGFNLAWHMIYGPRSWDANPWVWVISFRRLESS